MRSVTIDFISTTIEINDLGDPIETKAYRTVYAEKMSIRQSEFYQAAATGLKPEIMFEIRTIDYDNENKLKFNEKEYKVIRAYEKGEYTEIICQGLTNGEM